MTLDNQGEPAAGRDGECWNAFCVRGPDCDGLNHVDMDHGEWTQARGAEWCPSCRAYAAGCGHPVMFESDREKVERMKAEEFASRPRGTYKGRCFTPECPGVGTLISVVEPRFTDDPLGRYRCEPCRDVLAQLVTSETAPEEARRILAMSATELRPSH